MIGVRTTPTRSFYVSPQGRRDAGRSFEKTSLRPSVSAVKTWKDCVNFPRMPTINRRFNGRAHTVDVDESTPLFYVLSDELAMNGPKFGCGLGQCGACTVIVSGGSSMGDGRGQASRSCVTPV